MFIKIFRRTLLLFIAGSVTFSCYTQLALSRPDSESYYSQNEQQDTAYYQEDDYQDYPVVINQYFYDDFDWYFHRPVGFYTRYSTHYWWATWYNDWYWYDPFYAPVGVLILTPPYWYPGPFYNYCWSCDGPGITYAPRPFGKSNHIRQRSRRSSTNLTSQRLGSTTVYSATSNKSARQTTRYKTSTRSRRSSVRNVQHHNRRVYKQTSKRSNVPRRVQYHYRPSSSNNRRVIKSSSSSTTRRSTTRSSSSSRTTVKRSSSHKRSSRSN